MGDLWPLWMGDGEKGSFQGWKEPIMSSWEASDGGGTKVILQAVPS